MSLSLAEQLTGVMADIHRRGWCDGTGGNFSCVQGRDPLRLLMAPSGVDKGRVQPEELIVVDDAGLVVEGNGRASAETALHLAIVKHRDAGAVLHTHSQAATLLSRLVLQSPDQGSSARPSGWIELEGLEMLKGLEGIKSHEAHIRLPVLANDQDLIALSARAIPTIETAPQGMLLAGHGLYAWGSTLVIAKRHLEILEFLLEQRWRMQLMQALLRN